MASSSARSLIIDTDVGFDDLVANQCLLNTHSNPILTTVGGVIDAPRGAMALRKIFPQVQVAEGRNSPVMPYDPIPDWLQNYRSTSLDAFVQQMGESKNTDTEATTDDMSAALSRVMGVLENSPENSVDILCIGPLTNLAHWLDHYLQTGQIQQLTSKLHRIFILVGNHPHLPINQPEFNFGLDPQAARQVLESTHLQDKIHLVTTRSICDMTQLEKNLGKQQLQDFIEKQKTQQKGVFFETLLQFDAQAYCLSCDPVAAFAMDHPDSVTWEQVALRVEVPSGLVVPRKEGGDTEKGIRIAAEIDTQGYLKWIGSSVDAYDRTSSEDE